MALSSAELAERADLVLYELQEMVHDALHAIEFPYQTGADETLKNALLEAELVHARCLCEFLQNKPRGRDRVKAEDFAPSWTPPNETEIGKMYGRICNHLSHIGTQRLRYKPSWVHVDVVGAILDALEDFLDNLGTAPHEDAFRNHVAHFKSLHRTRIVPAAWRAQGPVTAVSATTSSTTMTTSFTIPGTTGPPRNP